MSTLEDLGAFIEGKLTRNQCALIAGDHSSVSRRLIKAICGQLAQLDLEERVMERCTSTALLSYLVTKLDLIDMGIMVTCAGVETETCAVKVFSKQGVLLETFEFDASDIKGDFSGDKILPEAGISKWLNVYKAHLEVQAPLDPAVHINRGLPIVMTTMRGAGSQLLSPVLRKLGFSGVMFVPEEERDDGQFVSADPRNPVALAEGMRYLRGSRAGMLLAIDPAGERLTVTVREDSGEYRLLSDSEVSLLLADYLCACRSENGILSKASVLITPEDSRLGAIARQYGIKHQVVAGDFTLIGAQLLKNNRGFFKHPLLLATDGQDGYLVGQYVNYRDALAAAVVMCEMYCFYESTDGVGMLEHLDELTSQS